MRPTRDSNGTGHPIAPYLALLRVGFTMRPLSPSARCALTAPFHPCLCRERPSAVSFLLHFPSSRDARALPGTLPYRARTFLRRTSPTAILTRHAHKQDVAKCPLVATPGNKKSKKNRGLALQLLTKLSGKKTACSDTVRCLLTQTESNSRIMWPLRLKPDNVRAVTTCTHPVL